MKKQGKNKTNILIFGRGQMAGFLFNYLDNAKISLADITKPNEIKKDLEKHSPSVVINTAAKTSIDWCELNKTEAFEVNTLGPFSIWTECLSRNIFFCHFSSGCIFSSTTYDQIFSEKDTPNPQCYYSWTKVWAENLLGHHPNLLILRPRMVISSEVDRRNTISKWLTYSHFISDQNTVTIIEDMLPVVADLVDRKISGTFHIANEGSISPLEVAYLLKNHVNPKLKINQTTLSEVNKNLVAKRCTTILDTSALQTIGYKLPSTNNSIIKVVMRFREKLEKMGGLKALDPVREESKQKFSITQRKASVYKPIN